MTPEQWEKVSEIFLSAAAREGAEREAFLAQACGDDDLIRREVESLLTANSNAGNFMLRPAIDEHPVHSFEERQPSLIGMVMGHYRIERSIGSGGMGEVYLATDTTLNRSVAFKTLPALLSNDPTFLKRFRNEAKAAATLNHPNVATIFSVENIDDKPCITMEYVDGRTLDSMTPMSGLDIKVFVRWFSQLADAINHAHAKGVVHRDIKPGNIMISSDGVPKILDFGLAQTAPRSPYEDRAETNITQPGQIIGTPAYLSPEQAMGMDVDLRRDIFSFGVVMYEAITGGRPFSGESNAEIISNVLKTEPPAISQIRPDVPIAISALIARCLRKPAGERYRSMREICKILGETKARLNAGVSTGSLGRRLYRETVQGGMAWRWAAGIAVLVLAFLGWYYFSSSASRPPISFDKMTMRRLSQSDNVGYTQIAPDGRSIAFATIEENDTRALWIRRVDDRNALQIVAPQHVSYWGGLAISEDGGQVYYLIAGRSATHGTLYRVSSLGGPPRKLVDAANDVGGISPDGQRILFVRYGVPSQIVTVNSLDGNTEQIIRSGPAGDSQTNFRDPQFSPDGKSVYYVKYERIDGIEYWSLMVLTLDGGTETQIVRQKDRISEIAVLRDSSGLLVTSTDPVSNLQQIFHVSLPGGTMTRVTNDLNFYYGISVDRDGRNIVTSQQFDENRVWVGAASDLASLKPLTQEQNAHRNVDWTPDGRIVYDAYDNNRAHIWIADADGKNVQQLTDASYDDSEPRVSGDGRYIVFTSNRSGLNQVWRMNIDGGDQVLLVDVSGSTQAPRFSSDGQTVVFNWLRESDRILGKVALAGGAAAELPQFEEMPLFNAYYWAMSPDSKYVAYTFRDEAEGRTKVAVKPADASEPTSVFNIWPSMIFKWMPDGRSIYYRERQFGYQPETTVLKVDIASREPKVLISAAPEIILDLTYSRDGKKIAVVRGKGTSNAVMLTAAAEK
jgi:serine/threonine protein kinase/Tol biopolymer transport system component